MDGNCLSECIVYKVSVTTANKYYYGNCKEHYNNHASSFRNKSCVKSNELSKCVWKLKEQDINCFINWKIAVKSYRHVCKSQKCDLCICQKHVIARANPNV